MQPFFRTLTLFLLTTVSLPQSALAADAAGAKIPVMGFAVALGVAVTGLFMLASGLMRIGQGTAGPAWRFGSFGGLGRFGRPDRMVGEARLRRAVTSIVMGAALLGLPDAFGIGVISQGKLLFRQVEASQARASRTPEPITIKEKAVVVGAGGSGGSTARWGSSFPWWVLSLIGLILLMTLLIRLTGASTLQARFRAPSAAPGLSVPVAVGEIGSWDGTGSAPASATNANLSWVEWLIEWVEYIKMKLAKLVEGLKFQAKLLEERTEGLRGRMRPVTDFATARIGDAMRIVADRDDGGSGLTHVRQIDDREGSLIAAYAQMHGERIGETQQLQGTDLEGLLARAFNTTTDRIKADLFRLGSTGAPKRWVRLSSAGPGRDWVLTEAATDPAEYRFDAVVAYERIDWYATMSVDARPMAVPFVISPLEWKQIHLVKVRDPAAAALVSTFEGVPERLADACWCFVDLPAEIARRTFDPEQRDRWTLDPDAPGDEMLMVHLERGQITVLSGQDDLERHFENQDDRPIRILVAVGEGGALVQLGATIDDMAPFDGFD